MKKLTFHFSSYHNRLFFCMKKYIQTGNEKKLIEIQSVLPKPKQNMCMRDRKIAVFIEYMNSTVCPW